MATVKGTKFAEALYGTDENDEYYGLEGNDVLVHSRGNDRFDGGAGTDTVDYRTAARGINISLIRGQGDDGEGGRDSYIDVEDVIGSNHNDTIEGSNVANMLNGGDGNDRLVGLNGNDTLFGGRGNDGLYGGADHDTIYGGDGDDTISGGTGNDTVSGGNGNDTFRGDAGVDAINGGAGVDTVDYSASPQTLPGVYGITGVFVNLDEGEGYIGDAEGDTLVGIENVRGTAYVDWIVGDEAANELRGNGGDDMIGGGAGADVLDGGEGIDIVSYWNSSAGVSIDLNESEASGGDATGDTISGFEWAFGSEHVDVLFGSNEGNELRGLGGNDLIDGDDGEDVIDGGMGDDTLIGGADADTFRFFGSSSMHDDLDVIVDFSVGVDRIQFNGTIDSMDELQVVQSGPHTFIGYSAASDPGIIVLYGVNTNDLLAQADTTFLFA